MLKLKFEKYAYGWFYILLFDFNLLRVMLVGFADSVDN